MRSPSGLGGLLQRLAKAFIRGEALLYRLGLLTAHGGQPFLQLEKLRLGPVSQVGEQLLVLHALDRAEQHGIRAEQQQGEVDLGPDFTFHAALQPRIMPPRPPGGPASASRPGKRPKSVRKSIMSRPSRASGWSESSQL